MALRTLPNSVVSEASRTAMVDALTAADVDRLKRYQGYLDFYNGKQWERRRPGRASLVLNYCRAVVDKVVSYLLGDGVNFAVAERDGIPAGAAALAEKLIYRVYDDSNLEAVDGQAATNGGVLGDTVFKVFWDETRGLPRVVSVDPMRFFCSWAEDDLSTLLKAHQIYTLSPEVAADRFGGAFPAGKVPVVETWTNASFEVWALGRKIIGQANPYGFIPFVHIPNSRPANEFWGISDLRDLIPLNRELNERFSDMADVIRFHSDPPVVFKGVNEHTELGVGPGTVWDIPADADVVLLEWRGQQPAAFEHIDRVMRAFHDVAETPKTAFGETGRIQSGVALEVELQSLIHKTLRKRAWWSAGLRARNSMILRIGELMGLGKFAPYRSRVVWAPLLPTDAEVDVRNNVALVEAGLRSKAAAMDRLGEESPEDELARIAGERGDEKEMGARSAGRGSRGRAPARKAGAP